VVFISPTSSPNAQSSALLESYAACVLKNGQKVPKDIRRLNKPGNLSSIYYF